MTQRKCPQPICMVNQPPLESEYKNLPSLSDKIFIEFKELFTRVGKIPNDRKLTQFHSPFKPVKSTGRRVLLHLLAGVNEELKRMETEGRIIKLEKCDEDQANFNYSEDGCFDQAVCRLQIIERPNF